MNSVGLLGDKCVLLVNKPLTKQEALELAAGIVLLCDGSLIDDCNNEGIVKWNTDSLFHRIYEKQYKGE